MTTRASIVCAAVLATLTMSCHREDDPRHALEQYLASAMRGDYATTYRWYDDAYRAKVSPDEYVRHRREASELQRYEVVSLTTAPDSAKAVVRLTFGPSRKLRRPAPVTTTVQEDLVRQRDGWRIRVW